jgi:hypothetical protein
MAENIFILNMGCACSVRTQKYKINVKSSKNSFIETSEPQNNNKMGPSLFIIREESPKFEESALPSRVQSSHPNHVHIDSR